MFISETNSRHVLPVLFRMMFEKQTFVKKRSIVKETFWQTDYNTNKLQVFVRNIEIFVDHAEASVFDYLPATSDK